jgi:oligoendopeptidase F
MTQKRFLPEDFLLSAWQDIEPIFQELLNRQIDSKMSFTEFLRNISELEAAIEEDAGWRYIKMSTDTASDEKRERYTYFVNEIQPKIAPVSNALNQKILELSAKYEITEPGYFIFFRSLRTSVELFREENVPLEAEIQTESQKYGAITGNWTIEWEGKTITLQQASMLLKGTDRSVREKVWNLVNNARQKDTEQLNELYHKLVGLRHTLAVNAGFQNFRDYKFKAMERFDYTAKDCFDFHQSIAEHIIPFNKELDVHRLSNLGYESLKPWDTAVDPDGREPLRPFETPDELIEKTISAFHSIKPEYGALMQRMKDMGHLDLGSRPGKMPGGYNYPLYKTGIPFIFMNAAGSENDLITMFHEGGHAIQSYLNHSLELTAFKNLHSEVAELASMSMELISMDTWHLFYNDEDSLKRARQDQLEKVLSILPWIAQVDEFQHHVYTNVQWTMDERNRKWVELSKKYGTGVVDWTGYEYLKPTGWHRQLHLFEVPFYYIEYGMAQLGAIALWKNYKESGRDALNLYEKALSLGNTATIPEVYKAAGIEFNFTSEYVKSLVAFVKAELKGITG